MRRTRTRSFEGGIETEEAVGVLSFEGKPVQD
jgi:hypothetical protein